jgi:hypothetical protein
MSGPPEREEPLPTIDELLEKTGWADKLKHARAQRAAILRDRPQRRPLPVRKPWEAEAAAPQAPERPPERARPPAPSPGHSWRRHRRLRGAWAVILLAIGAVATAGLAPSGVRDGLSDIVARIVGPPDAIALAWKPDPPALPAGAPGLPGSEPGRLPGPDAVDLARHGEAGPAQMSPPPVWIEAGLAQGLVVWSFPDPGPRLPEIGPEIGPENRPEGARGHPRPAALTSPEAGELRRIEAASPPAPSAEFSLAGLPLPAGPDDPAASPRGEAALARPAPPGHPAPLQDRAWQPDSPGPPRPNIAIFLPDGEAEARLDGVVAALASAGVETKRMGRVGFRVTSTQARYFHASDAAAAARMAGLVDGAAQDFTDFRPIPPEGTIEIWLEGDRLPRKAVASKRHRGRAAAQTAPAAPAALGTWLSRTFGTGDREVIGRARTTRDRPGSDRTARSDTSPGDRSGDRRGGSGSGGRGDSADSGAAGEGTNGGAGGTSGAGPGGGSQGGSPASGQQGGGTAGTGGTSANDAGGPTAMDSDRGKGAGSDRGKSNGNGNGKGGGKSKGGDKSKGKGKGNGKDRGGGKKRD